MLSAVLASALFAPLLIAFFTGPALVIASLLCCFKSNRPAATLPDIERQD